MPIQEKMSVPLPSSLMGRPAFNIRFLLGLTGLLTIVAIGCALPEREHVDPVAIKTDVLGCDNATVTGTLINDFLMDASGTLTVQWVDFFGDIYYEQSEGPFDVPAGGRTDWTIHVAEDIDVPGHCTVELDFRG